MVTALVNASNQSLALSTWSSYRTAESHLRQCEIDTGVNIRFPMTDREMLYNIKIQKLSKVKLDRVGQEMFNVNNLTQRGRIILFPPPH